MTKTATDYSATLPCRDVLDAADFLHAYDFDNSEATNRQVNALVKRALAAGWVPPSERPSPLLNADLRTVTISQRKAANAGRRYTDQFLGLTVVEATFDGHAFVGTVTAVDALGYATVTAPDGRWMRASSHNLRTPVAR